MSPLTVIDLFSGIGGFSLGLERTGGFKTISLCEIDPFCRRVLAKHWPEVRCHDDVRTRQFVEGEADVIVGGFPCQDVSHAGPRSGLAGERSGLYRELVRAICLVRPKHAILENVAALLGDGLDTVLGDLAESRFDAEWDCVPAFAVGAPHERDRVFIVAHAESDGCRQGRTGRPPDSFARVRDEARRNTRSGSYEAAWPDEPTLLGGDDRPSDWAHRVRAIGNGLHVKIPELIGAAILASVAAASPSVVGE